MACDMWFHSLAIDQTMIWNHEMGRITNFSTLVRLCMCLLIGIWLTMTMAVFCIVHTYCIAPRLFWVLAACSYTLRLKVNNVGDYRKEQLQLPTWLNIFTVPGLAWHHLNNFVCANISSLRYRSRVGSNCGARTDYFTWCLAKLYFRL